MTEKAFPFHLDAVKDRGASLAKADGSYAEALLYNMLREQLPADWSFIAGVQLGAHEYDFLVMVPGRGIVNVECKGHGYSFIGATNKFSWYNRESGTTEVKDLIGQASSARNYYLGYLSDALFGRGYYWGVMAYCLVFPLDEMSGINLKSLPIYRKSDCLAESKGLANIILESLDFAERQLVARGIRHPTRLSDADAATIWRFWTQIEDRSTYTFASVKLDLSAYREQMRNLLTVSQQSVLQSIIDPLRLRIFIEGSAGTGKTFLAMAAASELRGRILYVCFNKVLARYVHCVMPERQELLITHFHKFSDAVLGRPLSVQRHEGEKESEFWKRMDETLLSEVKKLKPGTYPLFDAIIVDEAQDLTKTQLKCLMRFCNSRGGKLILFSDAEQNIYRDRLNEEALRSIFRDLTVQQLSVNLRNPKPVVEYCRTLVPAERDVKIVLNGPAVVHRELKKDEVNAFLKDEVFAHYNPRDVAVISPEAELLVGRETGVGASFYGPDDNIKKTEKNLKAWNENRCAWRSTTHAFKGLEAMAVVHLLPTKYSSDSIKYVGGSRATFQLYLITIVE
jgi:hypothetical protein